MTSDDNVTEDDILNAIVESLQISDKSGRVEPGTITAPEARDELREKRGIIISEYRARQLMRGLAAQGVCTPDMVWRVDPWGYKVMRRGYRYTGGEKDDSSTKAR